MKRIITICLILTALALSLPTAGQVLVVYTNRRLQTVEGWGVSLCWWAGQCGRWSDAQADSLVRWLASPEGLNYNVFRYNIPGGDDPQWRHCEPHHMGRGKGLRAEMPGTLAEEGTFRPMNDRAQIRILQKLLQLRPDAMVEAFSNTPPYHMTVSGCAAGNESPTADNLRPERMDDFCDFLVRTCTWFRDSLGIVFHSLEPFNEPNTNYWNRNGSQEGCHFDDATMRALVKRLKPKMQAAGLVATRLAATDETNLGTSIRTLRDFQTDTEAMAAVDQWNVHTYGGTHAERETLRCLAAEAGKPLWMSETGSGGKGLMGNLRLSQRLIDDMKLLRPAVWCDWQAMEENNDQWCTVSGRFDGSAFLRNKNYYVRMQATRFIRRGYTMLDVDDAQTLAAVASDERTVVILTQNTSDQPRELAFQIPGFRLKRVSRYTTDQTRNCHPDRDVRRQKGKDKDTVLLTVGAQSITTLVLTR